MALEQLFPQRGAIEPSDAYADLALAESGPPGRPYVIANMICSVDGRAARGGRTEQLSSETDRRLLAELRGQVDAVMAGTRTIAIERYGPFARSAQRREQRRLQGLEPVPLAVTATRTMDLPVDAPLFQDPDSRVVVLTNSDQEPPPAPAAVTVERVAGGELDLKAALERLWTANGVRSLLLEGGPTLLAAMVRARVVDELFLTIAASLTGGGGDPTILEGEPPAEPVQLSLKAAMREGSFLFLRYGLGADR